MAFSVKKKLKVMNMQLMKTKRIILAGRWFPKVIALSLLVIRINNVSVIYNQSISNQLYLNSKQVTQIALAFKNQALQVSLRRMLALQVSSLKDQREVLGYQMQTLMTLMKERSMQAAAIGIRHNSK